MTDEITPGVQVHVDNAIRALETKTILSVVYDGKQKDVEVHAVGLSTKDNAPVIRAFQVDGEASRPLPCWALLRADQINASTTLPLIASEAPRPGYARGDKQMSKIIKEITL